MMDQIIKALLDVNERALVYLTLGFIGGALGALIRARRRKSGLLRWGDLVDTVLWACAGAFFAFSIDFHPVISFGSGLFAPLFYDLLEKLLPGILSNIIIKFGKGANSPIDEVKTNGTKKTEH